MTWNYYAAGSDLRIWTYAASLQWGIQQLVWLRPLPFKSRYNSQRVPTRGAPMPVYDYICNDCKKSFETVLTLAEHDKERISCPHCGSKNVEQEAAAFFAVTGKKS
jgi:putative FmdB family regulatory protein